MNPSEPLYIGIGKHVVAIDRATGAELWRCKLGRSSYITVFADQTSVYAGVSGELYCVDKATGHLRWHNPLSGLSTGVIAFCGDSESSVTASVIADQHATTTAVMGTAASG